MSGAKACRIFHANSIPAALPPILPRADPARVDELEIVGGEPAFGHAHEIQVVADHGFDQHDDDLLAGGGARPACSSCGSDS